jgi:hypothetical protein
MIFKTLHQTYIRKTVFIVSIFLVLIGIFFFINEKVQAQQLLQQPTGTIPTVTGTPEGVTTTVLMGQEPQINVRSGPGTFYNKVGVVLPGQEVHVLGKSAGGGWLLIIYPGIPGNSAWIYSAYVAPLTRGEVPIVEPPPTSTPLYTPTIDPTLAAQFIETPIPTKLATFTQVAPLTIPTFQDASPSSLAAGLPIGLIIIILGGLGVLIGIFSVLQTR